MQAQTIINPHPFLGASRILRILPIKEVDENHASTRRGISEYLFEQVDVEFAGRGGAFLWILFTAQRVERKRTSLSPVMKTWSLIKVSVPKTTILEGNLPWICFYSIDLQELGTLNNFPKGPLHQPQTPNSEILMPATLILKSKPLYNPNITPI